MPRRMSESHAPWNVNAAYTNWMLAATCAASVMGRELGSSAVGRRARGSAQETSFPAHSGRDSSAHDLRGHRTLRTSPTAECRSRARRYRAGPIGGQCRRLRAGQRQLGVGGPGDDAGARSIRSSERQARTCGRLHPPTRRSTYCASGARMCSCRTSACRGRMAIH